MIEHRDSYEIYNIPGNYLEARKWQFLSLPANEREEQVKRMFSTNDLDQNVLKLKSQLLEIVNRLTPDVIHAHSTYIVFNRVLHALVKDGELRGVALVATIHGLPKPIILPGGIKTTDYEQLAAYCPFDRILAVSDTVARSLHDLLAGQREDTRVQRLYIGINLDVFRPDSSKNKRWDVAFMGRLEPMKGVDVFPEMLEILRKKHPRLKMVMTGDGSLRETLLAELKAREVDTMVDYLGVVDARRVPEVINMSRVILYPSRQEPFGLSVLEGMACGVPVITANIYGPSEIVSHGIDGYTIPPGNPQVLADAVDTLLTDNELYRRISQNSRISVESKYDIQLHIPSLMEIYLELIKRKRGSQSPP
jgi:glycosyltransferase involved in cell wall biosynthesis